MTYSVSRLPENHADMPELHRMLKKAVQQGRKFSAGSRFTPHASPFTALDDSVFQQVMQMHDPYNSLGIVRDNERRDRIALHHFDCFGCQFIRSD